MRYKGKTLSGPAIQTLAIPRDSTTEPGDNDIIFQAQAVMDPEAFELIYPSPEPPSRLLPGDPPKQSRNTEDPEYQKALRAWAGKKSSWMILKSLSVTPDLEWERVKLDDPETYDEYPIELRESGFNDIEIRMIINLALKVNSIDEDKMEEARKRFLARQGQAAK